MWVLAIVFLTVCVVFGTYDFILWMGDPDIRGIALFLGVLFGIIFGTISVVTFQFGGWSFMAAADILMAILWFGWLERTRRRYARR